MLDARPHGQGSRVEQPNYAELRTRSIQMNTEIEIDRVSTRAVHATVVPVFALALLTSAALLFWVQPLIAKMLLPLLGGVPSVWNTCMVFFQALLLAGYAYAHATTAWLGVRRQAVLHLGVLLLPFLTLGLTVDRTLLDYGEGNPIPGLLLVLLGSVGL